jgi:hypothetical protein
MDLDVHTRIAKPLEELKTCGSVSEYLIAWSGPAGQLDPKVTVWCSHCNETELRATLAQRIGSIVPQSRIAILNDLP